MSRVFPVEEASRVSEVRRSAQTMAREQGMDETMCGRVAVIATELCTNLFKHASGGEIFLSERTGSGEPGIEFIALDCGPGMADVSACVTDGFSTSKTAGTGLGAVARLSQGLDIYSQPTLGTVVVAQIGGGGGAGRFDVGGVVKPMRGEDVSGDAWAYREQNGKLTVLVADGLGHGIMAARASAEAVAAFQGARDLAPGAVLDTVHRALRSTRGAAVAVLGVDSLNGAVQFAGLGNIGAVLAGGGKPRSMVSHSGTAGYGTPRIQTFAYELPVGGVAVMHSDGLTTSWNLDSFPHLCEHSASAMAATLYRGASRNRDDTCVVVIKPRRGA